MVYEKILFKDISHLELWRLLYYARQNSLCNFGTSDHEEQFCEIIWNLNSSGDVIVRYFLSIALEAVLFSRVDPLVQFR